MPIHSEYSLLQKTFLPPPPLIHPQTLTHSCLPIHTHTHTHTHTHSNNVVESYTAPEPTGWGLPVTNPVSTSTTAGPKEGLNTFSYPQFPALTPALYGPIRPARLLLQKPEKGRQLSQSSKELQETIEARTRTLGRTDSLRSISDSATKKLIMKERMARSKIRNLKVVQSIVKIQSLYRMLRPRRAYKRTLSVSFECYDVIVYIEECLVSQLSLFSVELP